MIPLTVDGLENDKTMHIVTDLDLMTNQETNVDGCFSEKILSTVDLKTVEGLQEKRETRRSDVQRHGGEYPRGIPSIDPGGDPQPVGFENVQVLLRKQSLPDGELLSEGWRSRKHIADDQIQH